MKTILLICAFAALAAAHPSEDVETDLLTPSTVVPETTFLEGKQTTKGLPQCADIHAETLCTKKSCNSQKGRSTSCLCIPGSQEASGKNKKYGAKYKKKGYKGCFKYPAKVLKAIAPSKRPKGCDDGWGMVVAKDCAPPKHKWWITPAPKCNCVVDTGSGFKKGKHIYVHEGHKHGSVYKWKGKNFRGIHCKGCSLVKLYDDDRLKRHRQHKSLKCCTGKTCDFTDAKGWFHDLRDDLSKIKLVQDCPATYNNAEIKKRRL
jgi:hypothetical protein